MRQLLPPNGQDALSFSWLRDKLHAQGRRLSATIRLHQVKYRADTGVAPVDRGMLMAYNLLPPDQAGERSSILLDTIIPISE